MAQLSLSPDQQLAAKVLLNKKNPTEEEQRHIAVIKENNLVSDDSQNQSVLEKFFSDKPGTEMAVRTGAAAAGEIGGGMAANKYGVKLLEKLPGPIGKIAKGIGLLSRTAGEAGGAFGGDVAGQVMTGQDLDVNESKNNALMSLFTTGAFKGGRAGVNKFRGKRLEKELESPQALRGFQRVFSAAGQAGAEKITASAAAVIKSTPIEIATSIAKNAPLSSGSMRQAGDKVFEFYDDLIDGYSKSFVRTGSRQQIGEHLQAVLKDAVATASASRNKIVGELDDLTDGVGLVDLKKIGIDSPVSFKEAVELLDDSTERAADEIIKQMKLANKTLITNADAVGADLIANASDNAALIASINKNTGKAGGKGIKELDASVDAAVMFTEKNASVLQGSLVKKLAAQKPHIIVGQLTQDPKLLKNVMDIISDQPGLVDNVRSAFLGGASEGAGLLGVSARTIDGVKVLDPNILVDKIKQFRALHGEAEVAFFGKNGLKGLEELAEEMGALIADKGSKAGTMSIFLQTPAAAATIASIPFGVPAAVAITGAGTILFGPKAIAGVLNNPKWAKRMVEGVTKFKDDELKLTKFFADFVGQAAAEGFNVSWDPSERQGITFPSFQGAGGL